MSWGVWFIIAAIVATGVLFAAGVVRAALGARDLVRRTQRMTRLDLDLDAARSAVNRIQADLAAMTALLERARAAMASIDANVRAMIRAFSRG